MHYDWKDRFSSLKEAGNYFKPIADFAEYGTYCLDREKGLRKKAFGALNSFIQNCRTRSIDKQRAVATELCSTHKIDPHIFQYDVSLVPKPLTNYLLEVISNWNDEDSSDPIRWHWLCSLSGDSDLVNRGLETHPDDETLLSRRINLTLNSVNYQMHHVQDGGFIGSIDEAASNIAYLAESAMRLPPGDSKNRILNEIKYYKSLLSAWIAYFKAGRPASFPKWSRQQGYSFEFHESYYL